MGNPSQLGDSPSCSKVVCEIVLLALTSVVYAADIVINVFATGRVGPVTRFGFKNQTGEVYPTQVTPAGWTFAIWGLIYAWQVLWLVYAWSFVFRPRAQRTIFWGVYPAFLLVCVAIIGWFYTWGNEYPQGALPFILLMAILLYVAIGMLTYHLYRKTKDLEEEGQKCDLWMTRIIVLNGLALYASWISVATCLNVGVVIQYYTPPGTGLGLTEGSGSAAGSGNGTSGGLNTPLDVNSGTVTLALLAFIVVVYFILENTVLDRFTRFVLVAYPTVIWALAGAVQGQWNKHENPRNQIFSLVLLGVVVLLACIRVVLLIVFACVRPLVRYEKLHHV